MFPAQMPQSESQEFLIAMDASTGLYLLALINVDLRKVAHYAPRDWLESMQSFACYLADHLPESERMPVPSMRALALQRI